MTKQQESFYTKIAIGAGVYLFVLRPLLQKFGIAATREDRLIKAQETLPNNQNAFSPLFWKTGPAGTKILKVEPASQMAAKIYFAMGNFTDDESAIYGVFRSLGTQSQVSFLSARFTDMYKVDLLDFLKRGRNQYNPASGLNADELAVVLNIVNQLPKYK
jgi:hypothetical protein